MNKSRARSRTVVNLCRFCSRTFPLQIACVIHERCEHGELIPEPEPEPVADKTQVDEIKINNHGSSWSKHSHSLNRMNLSDIYNFDEIETATSTTSPAPASMSPPATTTTPEVFENPMNDIYLSSQNFEVASPRKAETTNPMNPEPTYTLSLVDCDISLAPLDRDVDDDNNDNSDSPLTSIEIVSTEEDEDVDDRFPGIITSRNHLSQVVYTDHTHVPDAVFEESLSPVSMDCLVNQSNVYPDNDNDNGSDSEQDGQDPLTPPETELGDDNGNENEGTENAMESTVEDPHTASHNVIKVRKDLKLLKCRVDGCYRVFTDTLQLIHHAEMSHYVFMCRHCESVMLSRVERDGHYLKRHPEHVRFVDPDPQLMLMDTTMSDDIIMTDPFSFLFDDQAQPEQDYIMNTPDDTDDEDNDQDGGNPEESSSRHSHSDIPDEAETDPDPDPDPNDDFTPDSPPPLLLPAASTESFQILLEEENFEMSPNSSSNGDTESIDPFISTSTEPLPPPMTLSPKEAFKIGNRANPIVLLEQIDSSTLACIDQYSTASASEISKYQSDSDERSLPRKIKTLTCSVCKGLFTQTLLYLQHRRGCKGKGKPTVYVTPVFRDSHNKSRDRDSSFIAGSKKPSVERSCQGSENHDDDDDDYTHENTNPSKVITRRPSTPKYISKSIKCENCSRKFRNENSFLTHFEKQCQKNSYIPMYKCKHCEQGFSRIVNLKHHMNSLHTVKESSQIQNQSQPPAKTQKTFHDSPPILECFSNVNPSRASSIVNIHTHPSANSSSPSTTNISWGEAKSSGHKDQDRKSIRSSTSSVEGNSSLKTKVNDENQHKRPRQRSPTIPSKLAKLQKLAPHSSSSKDHHSNTKYLSKSKSSQPSHSKSKPKSNLSSATSASSSSSSITKKNSNSKHQPQTTSNQRRLNCNECGKSFSDMALFTQHLLDHNEAKAANLGKQPPLEKSSKPAKTASRHSHLPAPQDQDGVSRLALTLYKCVICGGGFHKWNDMVAHVKSGHSRKGKYGCMDCRKIFTHATDLLSHSQKHDKPAAAAVGMDKASQVKSQNRRPGHGNKNTPKFITATKSTKIQQVEVVKEKTTAKAHVPPIPEHVYPCSGSGNNCKEIFDTLSLLNAHRAQAHPENKFFLCTQPGCDIPFIHSKGLRRHLKYDHNLFDKEKEKKQSRTSSKKYNRSSSSSSQKNKRSDHVHSKR